jgi:hypothetical protein
MTEIFISLGQAYILDLQNKIPEGAYFVSNQDPTGKDRIKLVFPCGEDALAFRLKFGL